MSARAYADRLAPYARRAGSDTSLPVSLILAQWALESDWGDSRLATQFNNQAGIKHVSESIAQGGDGYGFAAYSDLNQFTADYIRVLNLSYYDHVRVEGAAGSPPDVVALALGRSPYDEGHYRDGIDGGKLIAVLDANPWLLAFDQPTVSPFPIAGGGGAGNAMLIGLAAALVLLSLLRPES